MPNQHLVAIDAARRRRAENQRRKTGKTPSDQNEPFVYLVPAVDKAFQILEVLKSELREMTISEIARATGLHKSSVQKLLVTLSHHGVVERDPLSLRYSLGITLAEYGRRALDNLDIRRKAKPFLDLLVEYSGETAVLAILNGNKMVMVDKKEPLIPIRVSPFIGMRFPATATSNGKVLLAWLPESEVDAIIKKEGLPAQTKNSITDRVAYRTELSATRERGYALDFGEWDEGGSGVSAPIFSPKGQVVATLSIVGPSFRMTKSKMRDYGMKCIEICNRLTAQLSHP